MNFAETYLDYYFKDEMKNTVDTAYACSRGKSISFAVCADTHYGFTGDNGYTVTGVDSVIEGMFHHMKIFHEQYPVDGLIHLGDSYEGNHPKAETVQLLKKIQMQMRFVGTHTYTLLGNHDDNSEYNHQEGIPDPFTQEELFSYLHRYNDTQISGQNINNYFYLDYDNVKVRCIFLNSIYHHYVDIGFSDEQMDWLEQEALHTIPIDYDILIFSHCPIRKNLNWNNENIHNDERLQRILREFHSNTKHHILAYIHGHVHVDSYNYDPTLGFPMIGIGCSKFENISPTDRNVGFPPNSVKPLRVLGTASEELWDTIIYNATEQKLYFVRFGAGSDRTVDLAMHRV